MAYNAQKGSAKAHMITAFIEATILTATSIELWTIAVQGFVNSVVHGGDGLAAALFGRLAERLPLIDPGWGLPLTGIDALRDGFYGGFMLASYALIACTVLLAIGIPAIRESAKRDDGTWNGPKRSKAIEGGARLERSKRAIRKATGSWKGESPAEDAGLAVGYIDGGFRIIGFVNAQVFGAVGSGKSRRVLIPTIANLIASKASMLVLDPKDELRFFTERYARKHGYRVLSLRLSDPARSPETYNPLSRAMGLAKHASDPCAIDDAIAEIATVASFVCPDSLHASNPYWTESARALFEGLALYMAMDASLDDSQKNLSTISALLTLIDEDGVTPLARIRSIARDLPITHPAKGKLSQIAGAPDETAESVISTLTAKLNSYADERISKALWDSSFELEELESPKTIMYVSFTNASGSYGAVVSTLVTQAISRLMAAAGGHGGRLRNDVYLIFEELAQTERMEKLAIDGNLFRSCGIHLLIVLQDRALLLARNYSDAEVRSILSTADDTLVLSVNDYASAEELSKRIGSYYAESRSESRSRSTHGAEPLRSASSSSGQSVGVMRVPLLPPEDLLAWDRSCGNLLIRKSGVYAIPSPDLSETFLNTELGRTGSEDEVNAQRAEEALSMPVLNAEPAPIWLPRICPGDGDGPGKEADLTAHGMETDGLQRAYNPLRPR